MFQVSSNRITSMLQHNDYWMSFGDTNTNNDDDNDFNNETYEDASTGSIFESVKCL